MWKKCFVVFSFLAILVTLVPAQTNAFDITGGSVWKNRVGPGIGVGLGLNGCGRDLCDRHMDTGWSIAGLVGFHYRIIPNLVVFGEIHTGHIPVDYGRDIDKDNGFAFQTTAGAEFHLPLTDWVAPYFGFGMGFAYLGTWVHHDDGRDAHTSLTGFDFQIRTGADFFPFRKAQFLSIGPALTFGIPAWITACYDVDGDEDCDDADDLFDDRYRHDLPVIVYIGGLAKFWF